MGKRHKILIIEDDRDTLEAVSELLSRQFEVLGSTDAKAGLRAVEREKPDLVLLDLRLPEMDGEAVLRRVRENQLTSHTPIIVMTAVEDDDRRAAAIVAGANDLISKPLYPKELVARIMSKLRENKEAGYRVRPRGKVTCGNLVLDHDRYEVSVAKRSVPLTAIEIGLLRLFIENKGNVLQREQILDTVWPQKDVSDRVVDNHILSLRKKLGRFNHEIISVYGAGYALKPRAAR